MAKAGFRIMPTCVLALSASTAHAAIEIQHEPITCVPLDRFARISAKGSPADQITRAELQFRADATTDWYSSRMEGGIGQWSGLLPRPRKPLEHFEYRIVMASASDESAETRPFTVSVSDGSTPCRSVLEPSPGPLVVTVPPGAPVVPPVPPGFSPVGVVAAQEQIRPAKGGVGKWAILGGVVIAGGVGAAVAAQGSNKAEAPPDIPQFSFSTTVPGPGNLLSLSGSTLQVIVHMSRQPAVPLTFNWRFELRTLPGGPPCVSMSGLFNGAKDPLDLILSSPFSPGACGTNFSTTEGQLTITIVDRQILNERIGIPFHFEP